MTAETIPGKLIALTAIIPFVLALMAVYQWIQTQTAGMLGAVVILLLSVWGVIGIAESVDSQLSRQTD
jgi:hypothetical protein